MAVRLILSFIASIVSLSFAKADAWDYDHHPARFSSNFKYDISGLPLEGQNPLSVPIEYDLWPAVLDGINWRPEPNELSPAEKYALVQGLNVAEFTEAVSRISGVLSSSKLCYDDQQCDTQHGEQCARRRDQSPNEPGRCVGSQQNLRRGLAAWMVKDPAPKKDVIRQTPSSQTIVFKPRDIAALQSLLWDLEAKAHALSPRSCRVKNLNPEGSRCRELNAGFYHIMLTNFIGLRRQAFVEDRTVNDELWNSPVSAYRILKMEALPNSEGQNFKKIGEQISRYFAVETEVFHGDIPVRISYVLEVDHKGSIVGGRWNSDGQSDSNAGHPDFIWTPGTPKKSKRLRGLDYGNIRDLLEDALIDDDNDQVTDFD